MRVRRFPNTAWREYWLWHPLQGAVVWAVFRLIALLPVDRASAVGGWLGRRLGPLVRTPNRRARHNLAIAFPDLGEAGREAILGDMWEHLGRVVAEYPHLERIRDTRRVEIVGAERLVDIYQKGKPIIFFGAHVGHWELGPVVGARFGVQSTAIYRPPNNRFVDRMTRRIRERCGLRLLARGTESTRVALAELERGGNLAILVDQRRAYGIPVPFFGRDTMTGPILAQLALRFDCHAMPVRVERLQGPTYRVTCYPPLEMPRSGDRQADVLAVMTRVNAIVESWIRERPAQWLWPHRRWG